MRRKIVFGILAFTLLIPLCLAKETVESWISKGNDWIRKGEYEKAIGDYEEALKLNNNNAVAHLSLGLAYAHTHKFDKAIEHGEKAAELDPSYTAYYNLGLIYASARDVTKAIQAFDKALEKSPESYMAYYQKGLVYTSQKEYEEALESQERAIELNRYFTDAYLAAAGVAYRLGRKEVARKQVADLRSLGREDLAAGLEKWIQDEDRGLKVSQPMNQAS